jgi:peptidoglycan/LPS O-acetylase OafA/YrhL
MINKSKVIPSLNGIRAISILIVIFSHYHILTQSLRRFYPLQILENGALGVNVFFAISGFLITYLLIEEEKKYGKISLKNFYKRRTLRIFPAYYFLLLVYFILQKNHLIYLSDHSWLSALTYTKYFNHSLDVYSEHLWSLSVEEHFYLFWPFIFVLLPSKRTVFLLFFIIAIPLVRIYAYNHTCKYFEIDSLTIFQRADSLMFGCLLAIHYEKFCFYFDKIFKVVKYPLLLVLLLLSLIIYIDEINTSFHLHLGLLTVPLLGASGTITILIILMLIVYSINYTGLWYSFLNSRIMDYIGRLSYSLYLWQQVIIFGSLGFISERPYSLLAIFLMANFSYYFIERPFFSLKNKFKK